MSKRQSIWTLGMLAFALGTAWAQDSSTQPASGTAPDSSQQQQEPTTQPTPAYGQENAPPAISENPPLSGLDLPSLEPHGAPLSYLQPGATISESADSNTSSTLGGQSVRSVSRALGSVTLQRLWSNYDLALNYVGGVAYYNVRGLGWKLMQQLDIDQKITWKRGQLSLRDSFSYLPEGTFGGTYGSQGSHGIGSLGNTAFGGIFSGASLGSLGQTPRLSNVSIADVSQELSPKSSMTAAGGYAFTHFYGRDTSGISFIASSQVSAQVGYNRLLSPHTQIALVYGYQGFDFNFTGTAFHSHVIQAMYGHRISGRMDLLAGAGPQITLIDLQGVACSDPTVPPQVCVLAGDSLVPTTTKDTRIGVAAQVRLRYKFPKAEVSLKYERFVTSGSGFFAGAQSDIVRVGVERPLTRVWSSFFDLGYSRNSREQPLTPTNTCGGVGQPACPGIDAKIFTSGFAGAGLHRSFGRNWHAFMSYQFNELSFDNSYCSTGLPCSRISNRHVATIGLDWTPRPLRID